MTKSVCGRELAKGMSEGKEEIKGGRAFGLLLFFQLARLSLPKRTDLGVGGEALKNYAVERKQLHNTLPSLLYFTFFVSFARARCAQLGINFAVIADYARKSANCYLLARACCASRAPS